MADRVSEAQRRRIMKSVGRVNTRPEMAVRSLLHHAGFRFRKNVKTLPGTPDIVLPKYRTVIFVHGCFWHQHPGCQKSGRPSSNVDFWNTKLDRNRLRDDRKAAELTSLGWSVVVVWECELADCDRLRTRLARELKPGTSSAS